MRDLRQLGTAPLSIIRPGDVIDGQYEVKHAIGGTASSTLLEAVGLRDRLPYAITIFDAQHVSKVFGGARLLLRDAERLIHLRHPNLLATVAAGELKHAPYVVTEWAVGVSLARSLADGGPLSIADASMWIGQACEGLAVAHANGIVHRDLRPENLIVALEPSGKRTLKVTGFALGDVGEIGEKSPSAAPEMRLGHPIDARADVWALGVVLYELVTGERPFDDDELALMLDRNEIPAARLITLPSRKPAPPAFQAVVSACLSIAKAERHADAAALGAELASASRAPPANDSAPTTVKTLPPAPSTPNRLQDEDATGAERTPPTQIPSTLHSVTDDPSSPTPTIARPNAIPAQSGVSPTMTSAQPYRRTAPPPPPEPPRDATSELDPPTPEMMTGGATLILERGMQRR